jgi:hypothetical protein
MYRDYYVGKSSLSKNFRITNFFEIFHKHLYLCSCLDEISNHPYFKPSLCGVAELYAQQLIFSVFLNVLNSMNERCETLGIPGFELF